jgi:hypothetical protein
MGNLLFPTANMRLEFWKTNRFSVNQPRAAAFVHRSALFVWCVCLLLQDLVQRCLLWLAVLEGMISVVLLHPVNG